MINKLEEILYPYTCVLTGKPAEGIDLSHEALDNLVLTENICPSCAHYSTSNRICGSCLKQSPIVERVQVAFMLNDVLKKMIHAFKYSQQLYYSRLLAELMLPEIETLGVQALLPVPLHINRLSSRGFNQSLELAKQLSARLNVPVVNAVARIKDTPQQVGLSGKERRVNVKDVFVVDKKFLEKYQSIAIIDDVITTGSTVNEVAKTIRQYYPSLIIQVWAVGKG